MARDYSRLKKAVFSIILILLILLLSLALLEISVRIAKMAPPLNHKGTFYKAGKYLPFKPRPNSQWVARTNEFTVEYKHNSLGFRDIEHPIEKPENTFRILALGDSFTYGEAVSFEDTYLYILEKMLNSRKGRHPKVEIIKMGVSNYYSTTELLLLENYGLQFKPDLIIVGFVRNDVIQASQGIGAVTVSENGYLLTREAEELGMFGTWFYLNSHAGRLILSKYISEKIRQKYPVNWEELCKDNGLHEKDWKKVESDYEKMIDLANQINAKILFIQIPEKNYHECAYSSFRLSRWFKEINVPFIDTAPYMFMLQVSLNKPVFWNEDAHFNRTGYKIVAESVYNELNSKNLIP